MAPREQDAIFTDAIGTPSFKIFGKAKEFPIVNDAIEVATKLHNEAVTYPYVNQVETIIGDLVSKAEDTITPRVSSTISSTVTSTATQLDTLACTGLDQVTAAVAALKLPTGELATATTEATLNLANTIQDYVAKFTVVRVLLTALGMLLGFAIKGLETVLGLLEGKAEIAGVVKPVLGHIYTFKLLLEDIVKRSKPVDVTKPLEDENQEGLIVEENQEAPMEEENQAIVEEENQEAPIVEELQEAPIVEEDLQKAPIVEELQKAPIVEEENQEAPISPVYNMEAFKLFVFGVDECIGEEDLAKEFRKFGEVVNVCNTGKGFAFVTMSTPEQANAALEELDGAQVFGNEIKVSIAVGKPAGGDRGGKSRGGHQRGKGRGGRGRQGHRRH